MFHQAEQARQEMAAVKSEADRYGAREKARTFYGRGLALQARAEELWERQTFQEAERQYAEARGIFADARDLAYRETFREEALSAQTEMRAAREAAEQEEAGLLAVESFQLASRTEEQAAAAMRGDEFRQARELYADARQQYGLAQQQAHAERQRQHAPAATEARLQMEAARAAVGTYGEQPQFAAPLAQARQLEEQGRANEQQGELVNAVSLYELARREYERVREEGEQARRQLQELVVQARAEALAAKEKAQTVDAADHAREAFTKASKSEDLANAALARGDFASARELYQSAATEFALAEQHAVAEQHQLRAQEEKRRLQEQHSVAPTSPIPSEERQVSSSPPIDMRTGERRKQSSRAPALAWGLAAIGLILIGGFYWRENSHSVLPQLPAASRPVPSPASSSPAQPLPRTGSSPVESTGCRHPQSTLQAPRSRPPSLGDYWTLTV